MEPIIKKAMEVGYTRTNHNFLENIQVFDENAVVLDPLFWQALGKACGWGEKDEWTTTSCDCGGQGIHPLQDLHSKECNRVVNAKRGWLFWAEKFHQINLTEGWNSAVKYVNSLIK